MKISGKFLTIVFLTCCLCPSISMADDDLEYWSEYELSYKLTDKTKLVFSPKIQMRDNASELYFWELKPGIKYRAHKHLDLAFYYYYSQEKKAGSVWSTENRLRTDATLNWKIGDFKFADRNRYEWRNFDNKPRNRYRNRIKISTPVTIFNQDITPFVANEFFYDFEKNEYNQNRSFVGFSKKLSSNVTADLYYMYKMSKGSNDWSGHNTIGTNIKIAL